MDNNNDGNNDALIEKFQKKYGDRTIQEVSHDHLLKEQRKRKDALEKRELQKERD